MGREIIVRIEHFPEVQFAIRKALADKLRKEAAAADGEALRLALFRIAGEFEAGVD